MKGIALLFTQIFNTKTKNPERLIECIKDMNFVKGMTRQFYIECVEENAKVKKIVFETKTAALASYIYAKLTFLM